MARAKSAKKSPAKKTAVKRASPTKARGGKAATKASRSPAAAKGSPKKKAKKQKDPNAPKRGMSAYMLWLKENRARLSKPGLAVTEVSKAAGVEWNALKDKTKWNNLAANDKKRYERENAAYKGKKK